MYRGEEDVAPSETKSKKNKDIDLWKRVAGRNGTEKQFIVHMVHVWLRH